MAKSNILIWTDIDSIFDSNENSEFKDQRCKRIYYVHSEYWTLHRNFNWITTTRRIESICIVHCFIFSYKYISMVYFELHYRCIAKCVSCIDWEWCSHRGWYIERPASNWMIFGLFKSCFTNTFWWDVQCNASFLRIVDFDQEIYSHQVIVTLHLKRTTNKIFK